MNQVFKNLFDAYIFLGLATYIFLARRIYTLFTISQNWAMMVAVYIVLTMLADDNLPWLMAVLLWIGVIVHIANMLTNPFETAREDENPLLLLVEDTIYVAADIFLWPIAVWAGRKRARERRSRN